MRNTETSSSSAGAITGGLALIVLAGVLNGSWNASFSPKVGWAVGRRPREATTTTTTVNTPAAAATPGQDGDGEAEDEAQHINSMKEKVVVVMDLDYHYAWLLFQLYAALVNLPLCIYWTGGPARTSWIVQQTSAKSIALVCTFSLLWGVGSVGFGLACRVAGLGLGTNLTMGVITIAGTLLPLILQNLVATAFGAVILAGLVVCSMGLYFSMSSLQIRDGDERHAAAAAADNALKIQEARSTRELTTTADAGTTSEQDVNDNLSIPHQTDSWQQQQVGHHHNYSTLFKVLLCIISGLFASMLQFAFVYGEPMIQLAASNDGPNAPTTSTGTASIVWLFAFSISCPVSILYGIIGSPKNIPFSTMWKCPWHRHVLLFLTSTLPWIAHIHLYGIANHPMLLPPRLAATVSWPILMMTTVATGMIWSSSSMLGEWKLASLAAKRQLTISLCTITTGIVILMTSLAVAE
jgi:L-rhamnose-proton symport protein (RhaT)